MRVRGNESSASRRRYESDPGITPEEASSHDRFEMAVDLLWLEIEGHNVS